MIGVVWAGAALAGLLGVVEALRRVLRVPCELTRPLLFLLVGTSAIPIVHHLDAPVARALPFLFLSLLTYISFRYELLGALEDNGPSPGSVLFPLACALVLGLSSRAHIALGGILAISFGDTAAALVGRRTGTRKFRMLGHARTMEGTLAMFLGASAAIAAVLIVAGGLDSHRAVAFGLIAGTVAAAVESTCPHGSDNFLVPVSTALTLTALERFSQ